MVKEVLRFGEGVDEGVIEVSITDNVIYLKTLKLYTDEMAMKMTVYLEGKMNESERGVIRVWDSTDLPADCFQLSGTCVKSLARWSSGLKGRWPDNRVYFIAPEALTFGVSRMYGLRVDAQNDEQDVFVLNSLADLPAEIMNKIHQ